MSSPGWSNNPGETIEGQLAARGFDPRSLLAAYPHLGWPDLVAAVPLDVVPVLLLQRVRRASYEEGWLNWFARDALDRELRDWLADGWPAGGDDTRLALALASWETSVDVDHALTVALRQIYNALKGGSPAPGWLPRGADDPALQAAFRHVDLQSIAGHRARRGS